MSIENQSGQQQWRIKFFLLELNGKWSKNIIKNTLMWSLMAFRTYFLCTLFYLGFFPSTELWIPDVIEVPLSPIYSLPYFHYASYTLISNSSILSIGFCASPPSPPKKVLNSTGPYFRASSITVDTRLSLCRPSS